jgi:hypothetical protein
MSATMLPPRTLQQRMDALEKGNLIRCYRAELKRKIKAGLVTVDEVLAEPGPLLESMKVYDLLLAAPYHGHVKVGKIMRATSISPSRTVGGLTERQRGELAGIVREFERLRVLRRVAG